MKAITKGDFFNSFFLLSKRLTIAELRLLYILITEPDSIDLSQQEIADKIGTHRRTVNIGLKTLKELGYISNVHFDEEENNIIEYGKEGDTKNEITTMDFNYAKKTIREKFVQYYRPEKNRKIIVNEDFFSHLLGDKRFHEDLRKNKEFLTKSIKEGCPKCKFPSNLKPTDFESERHFQIIHYINKEIREARKFNRYYLDKDNLLLFLKENYYITEEDSIKLIRQYFPIFVKTAKKFRIPKPFLKWK